MEFSMNVFVK